MELMEQGTQGLCHERLATETGLSASFAPRRTRVVCVGGGDEEAGTLLQMRPRLTQDPFYLYPPYYLLLCRGKKE